VFYWCLIKKLDAIMIQFDLPKDQSSIIKVFGVGGGGSNAVNHMYSQGIKGVDFIICNTDQQALDMSMVPVKIALGESLTEGRGAGSIPEMGRNAAIENIDDIKEILLKNTKMVFVTAGMGGGTGTGAAPVIAQVARELGILTVGIVTMPFGFEGRKRRVQAEAGLAEMRDAVDTLLVINNDRLREMFGNLTLANAFAQADEVLTTAARGIAEVITVTGQINVDFEDVRTVMQDSGVAIMGSARAEGDERSIKAVEQALSSPLLNDNQIIGAKYVLLNITYGSEEVLMDEITEITDYIQDEAGDTADVIWGHGQDESLGAGMQVTIIATGFNANTEFGTAAESQREKKYISLEADVPTMITKPIASPTQSSAAPAAPERVIPETNWKPQPHVEPEASAPKETTPEQAAETSTWEPYLKSSSEPVEPKEVPQTSIEFDMTSRQSSPAAPQGEPEPQQAQQEVKRYYLDDEPVAKPEPQAQAPVPTPTVETPEAPVSREEQERRSADRVSRIKELSMKLKTPSGIADLESEPAYKRRNVQLNATPHSSESSVSRFTLSEEEGENGEKRTGLRPNNSFLHDNVD